MCQTQVGVPARPSPNHVLKQRHRRFANCYNCSAWRHHGYVSVSGILLYRSTSKCFLILKDRHTDSEGHMVALLHCSIALLLKEKFFIFCVGYQECTRRRMVSGTSPSLPYVCHYDTVEDVMQQREKIIVKTKGEPTSSVCGPSAAVLPVVVLLTSSFL